MRQRYAPTGQLALAPQAFGMLVDASSSPDVVQRDGVAMVEIRGPLEHRATWWCDSYEAIRARVADAIASGPKAVVMVIDSPGGVVKGCFDTTRALRQMAADAGVPLLAYVDGAALSAGYALACAAERIVMPATGLVGSIGTIEALVDASKQLEAYGLSYRLIASGERKLDGRPEIPTTDEAVQVAQRRVDDFAELFFALVSETRGVGADVLRGLEAAVLHGAQAVGAGLADEVGTIDQLLASASGQAPAPAGRASEESTMDEEEKKARAALQAIVDDDDADDKAKARARAALAAMDDDSDDGDTSAEDDDKSEDDDKDGGDAKASARVPSVSASTAGELATRLASVERQLEASQRAGILASRTDLSPGLVKLLESKPIAEVKAIVDAIPKPKKPKLGEAAAAATAGGTRGEGQGGTGTGPTTDPELAAVDRAMGLNDAPVLKAERRGNTLFLGPAPGDLSETPDEN